MVTQNGDFLTTGSAASKLGVTVQTIQLWVREKKIKAIRLPSGRIRIPRSAIAELLGENEQES